MIRSVETQLMFTGSAREAMDLYVETLGGSIIDLEVYPEDHPSLANKILRASFQIGDQRFSCIDSDPVHNFTFTPSMSVFVELDSVEELRRVSDILANGGELLMPPDNYGFSELFVWLNDRYGVSWQLNYAGAA